MPEGWEGYGIRLVARERERHLANALRWLNDPEVTKWLGGRDRLYTLAEENRVFDEFEAAKGDEIGFAIETLEGKHVGFCSLMEIEFRHGTAVCGTLIGDREFWGKGIGTAAARLRSRYAFEVQGLRMLKSVVFADNEASLRMLKRIGFVEYGRLPNSHWVRGEYRDDVFLYLTREKWAEVQEVP